MAGVFLKSARNNKKDKFGQIRLKTGFFCPLQESCWENVLGVWGKHTTACLSIQQQAESEQQMLKNQDFGVEVTSGELDHKLRSSLV